MFSFQLIRANQTWLFIFYFLLSSKKLLLYISNFVCLKVLVIVTYYVISATSPIHLWFEYVSCDEQI